MNQVPFAYALDGRNVQRLRPYPMVNGTVIPTFSKAKSNYNAFNLRVEKRHRNGLNFLTNYTWQKNMEEGGSGPSAFTQNGGTSIALDSYNLSREKGLAPIDVAHIFNVSYGYELPWGPGQRWASGAGVLGKIYLRFPRRFWPESPKWFGRLPDSPDRRGTFNTWVSHEGETGLPILLSFANGQTAVRLDRSASDDEVKEVALDSLRKMFPNQVMSPDAMIFPRWLSDPWSRGGYSYPGVGSAPEDRETHARPLGGRVFFAGEATEPVEYGTVHAALWSGEQTAEAIFKAATGAAPSRVKRPWAAARTGAGRHNEG